jgi:cell division protease FtsH
MKNDMLKNIFLWLIIAIILVSVFTNFGPRSSRPNSVSYSQFLANVNSGKVQDVTIDNETGMINGKTKTGENFDTFMPLMDPGLLPDLFKQKVDVKGKPPQEQSMWMRILISWFPFILLIGVWIFFMRRMQGGGGGGVMSFGRSKAKKLGEDQIKVTFADVAGCEEAKEEVSEIVDFLKDPKKFQNLGGQIPRGVLMMGPPGTGKTLLAKAVAGEAKVPFFSISGSDFVEMFVGVGASRVRDMFTQAKKNAPCIIFIDEIDAVGRHRGTGLGGGHDEREQTLNQLLVEMDGFEGNSGVIVIAASNRPDVLDPALLRPGRFDRQVAVGLPDVRGREQILKVHMRKVPLAKEIDASVIARGTPGFSGADLANLVNEAALMAARENKKMVSMPDFEHAKDKILMGPERRSMVMTEDEKKLTAYHESGHAIVGWTVPDHDPIHKVTIMPRGRALGVTMFLPDQDRYSYSKQRLESSISSMYGGRLAEEIIFGAEKVTTGASNDIQKASEIARNMVTKWGLSKDLGPLLYGEEDSQPFLGASMGSNKTPNFSGETAAKIDKEVRELVDRNYARSKKILEDNIDKLHAMADALMKYETIDLQQIEDIMAGRPVAEPKGWSDHNKMDQGPTAKADNAKEHDSTSAKPATEN